MAKDIPIRSMTEEDYRNCSTWQITTPFTLKDLEKFRAEKAARKAQEQSQTSPEKPKKP